jgi:O-antigen/teichoic acid export membrane protein
MGGIFLTRVLTGRYLGPTEYGVIIVGLTIAELSSVLLLFGFPAGLAQRLPRTDEPNTLFMSSLLVSIPLGGLFALVSVLFDNTLVALLGIEGNGQVLSLFFVALPLYLITKLAIGYVRGKEDVLGRFLIQNVGLQVLVLASVGVAISLDLTVYEIAFGWAGMFSFSAVISLLYLRLRYGPLLAPVSYETVRMLFVFSVPLMLSNTMWLVLQQADNLLLASYRTSTVVGIYDGAYTLARVILMLVSALGFLFLPMFSNLDSEGRIDEMKDLYQFSTKWVVFAGLVPLALFVTYSKSVITEVYGASYQSGGLTLTILAVGFFAQCLTGNSGNSLVAIGLTKVTALASVTAVIANISLNLVLIPPFGKNGAAVASAVAYALVNLIYIAVLYRETTIHPVSTELVQTLGVSTVAIGVFYFLPYEPAGLVSLFGVAALEVIVLSGIVLTFGMEQSDWNMLDSLVLDRIF